MNYHNIKHDDMLNGEGLRVTLFLSGCSHNCKGCHNPQTHDPNSGIKFTEEDLQELENYLDREYISGLTLSGGDPLFPANREEVKNLVKFLRNKYPKKSIWIYTGYCWEEIVANTEIREILEEVDVLIDGKFLEKLLSPNTPWVGSSNQRVIDCRKSLSENKIILY